MIAVSKQLLAEISASPYRSVRALACAMDLDYGTLIRNVNNKTPLRAERLLDVLDRLDLPLADFFVRVQLRIDGVQLHTLVSFNSAGGAPADVDE